MKCMAKVSVIIPVYNVEKYLSKCIDSVVHQTESDIEIILIDDGSTDACGQICDSYANADSRIAVIHQKNSGLGAARNVGIQTATAPYLLFVDSDDYIDTDLIEKAYKASQEQHADIVMFGYNRIHEDGSIDYSYDLPTSLSGISACSLKDCSAFLITTPSTWNKLYKATLFEDVLFPARAWYEDLQTIPKLYPKANAIYCMKDYRPYQYLLRHHPIMQNGNSEKTKTQRIQAVDELIRFFQKENLFDAYANELNWLYCFHGYFLPCREIMNFNGNTVPYLKELRRNLSAHLSDSQIFQNPYYASLSKKEQLIFSLLYKEKYTLLQIFLTCNHLLKK